MPCKQKITKCFNSKAQTYEQAADIQPLIAKNLTTRLTHLQPKSILEIGCGPGTFSEQIVEIFPQAQFLLTDIAPAMVDQTQKRFANKRNVQVKTMDGEAPNTLQQFDLITSSMALHWFSNIKRSFNQIIEKLTPGGKFIFAMLGHESLQEWRNIFHQFSHTPPTPLFPQQEQLKLAYPNLQFDVELLQQKYPNTHTFLKTLKSIGAHAAHAKHISLPAGKLRKLMKHLDMNSTREITISYQVLYGSYIKS